MNEKTAATLKWMLFILLLPVAMVVIPILTLFGIGTSAAARFTHEELADMLRRFVRGETGEWEFDDYTSVRWPAELEPYRAEIVGLHDTHPATDGYCDAAGMARILEIADEIEDAGKAGRSDAPPAA